MENRPAPQSHYFDAPHRPADERWIKTWAGYGLEDLGAYLDQHARFDAYLRRTGRI